MSVSVHYSNLIDYATVLLKRHPSAKKILSATDFINEAYIKTDGCNDISIIKKSILNEILIEERRVLSHGESYAVDKERTRICIKCKEELSASFFRIIQTTNTESKPQVYSICISCEREYFKKLYKKEYRKIYLKKYMKNRPDDRVRVLSDDYIRKLLSKQGHSNINFDDIEIKRRKLIEKRNRLQNKKAS